MSFRDEAEQTLKLWVERFTAGDVEGCLEVYTEDGEIYSPYGSPAIGRDALRETHEAWLAAGETNKRIIVLDARVENDLAYCVAVYFGDYPQEDGSVVTESGTSINVLLRQKDGSWRIHISSLNSDNPPLADD